MCVCVGLGLGQSPTHWAPLQKVRPPKAKANSLSHTVKKLPQTTEDQTCRTNTSNFSSHIQFNSHILKKKTFCVYLLNNTMFYFSVFSEVLE